jgi:3-oxoacyl-[acyl-carrier-protein] synthase II
MINGSKHKIKSLRKAVITGMGVICSIGNNRREVFENVRKATCGIGKVKLFKLDKLTTQMGGEVKNLPNDFPKEFQDRTIQLAYAAMQEAMDDSSLDIKKEDPYRCALSFGTCNGNILTLEEVYEERLVEKGQDLGLIYQNNYLAIDYLNKKFNIRGHKMVFVTACSASNNAIGYAYDLIARDEADIVIVGGSDSLARTTFGGFNSLQSLSEEGCVPFSERIGLSLGEGAAFMVMESEEHALKRNAKIHAEVLGYGFCGDAYHATSPDVTGDGALRTMRAAIEVSGINKENIAFICAHGTGTKANDKTESLAIKNYFGQHAKHLSIFSTKSLHGHTLGAAGIIQAVISIDCMNHSLAPAVVNFTKPREGCDLNYVVNKPIEKNYDYFISNSFAFGGNNVSVVFGKGKQDGQKRTLHSLGNKKIVITGLGYFTPLTQESSLSELLKLNNKITGKKVLPFTEPILTNPELRKFKKTPRISQFAIQSIEKALNDANYNTQGNETKIGMVWGVTKGPLKTFEKYYCGVLKEGLEFASALYFPHIVLNSIAGQASIAFGIKGCNTTVGGQFSPFGALQYASQLIQQGRNEIFIVGGADEISQFDESWMNKENFENQCLSEGAAALIIESAEYAKNRKAKIYAEIVGFSITSSHYDTNILESYKQCINNTLHFANLKEKDIDLHIPCQFGGFFPEIKNALNIRNISNSQDIIGTLEAGTAILNTIVGVVALNNGFAPRHDSPGELYRDDFRNILISGAAFNGTYYSFILRKF